MKLTLTEWQELAGLHATAMGAAKKLDYALAAAAAQSHNRDDTEGFDFLMSMAGHATEAITSLGRIDVAPQQQWVGMDKQGPVFRWVEPRYTGMGGGGYLDPLPEEGGTP